MEKDTTKKSLFEKMKDFRNKYEWETNEERDLVYEMVNRASARFLAYRCCKNTQCEFYMNGDYCSSRRKRCGINDDSVDEDELPIIEDDLMYEDNPTNVDVPLAVRFKWLLKFSHDLKHQIDLSNSRLTDVRQKYEELCRIYNTSIDEHNKQVELLQNSITLLKKTT